MNAVLLCLSGLVGSLVSRGTAYPGRFTVHLIPVAVTLAMCALALVTRGDETGHREPGLDWVGGAPMILQRTDLAP